MRRPIVAMGACLGAYLLQPWASVLAPTAAVIANAICFAVLSLCVRSLVARSLRQVQRSEPQAEMAVAHPQSFLPTGHLLFVTIFVFSIAQGLVIALLGWTEEALVWTSFASAMVFVTFCFLVLKNVSFAEAIGAIQTPEPAVAAAGLEEGGAVAGSSDEVSVSTRCDAVAAAFGLTPRESEVFALLAQGRTVGRDSREACHLAEHGLVPHEEYLCEVGGAFPAGAHRSGGGFRTVRIRDVRVLRRNRASWSPGREGRYGRTPARRKKPRCRNEGCSGVLTSEGLRVGRPQDMRGG